MVKERPKYAWTAEFRNAMKSFPANYAEAITVAREASHAFHQELATAISPRLNQQLQSMPHDSYEERQAVASWCNHELHSLRLCIRCPRTGRPGILLADVRGRDNDSSRFRLQVRDAKGQVSRTYSSQELPHLELMEDPPRREGLSRWRKGAGDGPARE